MDAMKKDELFTGLNLLKKGLEYKGLVQFRFSSVPGYDENLIDWFIDSGEIRIYRSNFIGRTYHIVLAKGEVQLNLNSVFKGCEKRTGVYPNKYIKRFWSKNKNLKYCTNNLLRTPEEIFSIPGNTRVNDTTYKCSDGSFIKNNVFHLSMDTFKTFKKREQEVIELLNSL